MLVAVSIDVSTNRPPRRGLRRTAFAIVLALTAASCGSSSGDVTSTAAPEPSPDSVDPDSVDAAGSGQPDPAMTDPDGTNPDAPQPEMSAPATDAAPVEPVPTEQRLVVTGPEEVVFDWTTDRCSDRNVPDTATRVVRNADGLVQLYLGEETTLRMIGDDFDSLTVDCTPVNVSSYDSDPSQFNDAEWISATYTQDGETVYAIVHNEYIGVSHRDVVPDQCPADILFDCLDVSLTLALSTDGGATFNDAAAAPDHMIATMPHVFNDEGVSSGVWHPTNLVDRGDGYLYMLADVNTYPETARDVGLGWICAMRTSDISDPDAWRYWDGAGWDGVFLDPYRDDVSDQQTCSPVDFPALSAELTGSIVWVEGLELYVSVGGTYEPGTDQENWGIYYSTSEDLLDWSPRRLLMDAPIPATQPDGADMTFLAYPTIVDPDSPSLNFDTTDGEAYLYVTRFNFGGNSLDRDLVRIPIAFEEHRFEPVEWNFDIDGDTAAWLPRFDLSELTAVDGSLTMTSTGDDPYMNITGLRIPSVFDTVEITMSVTASEPTGGQLFFLTEDDTVYGEDKFAWFEIEGIGELQTYTLDMSTIERWDGIITSIRIDPAAVADAEISIDSITVNR